MTVFFLFFSPFFISDRLDSQERRFPFGRELTTCQSLFRWRRGLACATVNKLKCSEAQILSSAPSKAFFNTAHCFWCVGQVCFLTHYENEKVSCAQKQFVKHTNTQNSMQHHQMSGTSRARCLFIMLHRMNVDIYTPPSSIIIVQYGGSLPCRLVNQHSSVSSPLACQAMPLAVSKQRNYELRDSVYRIPTDRFQLCMCAEKCITRTVCKNYGLCRP